MVNNFILGVIGAGFVLGVLVIGLVIYIEACIKLVKHWRR
jgi:hypothetical protein